MVAAVILRRYIERMTKTERLKLRSWTSDDLCFLDTFLGDPVVMKYSERGVLDKKEQAAWLYRNGEPKQQTYLPGTLAIEQINSEAVIGYVSLSNDEDWIAHDEAELGFRLARAAWGYGYATEAIGGILNLASGLDGLARIVAIVDPHNIRSVRVLKKIGMISKSDVVFEGYDHPDHLYAREF